MAYNLGSQHAVTVSASPGEVHGRSGQPATPREPGRAIHAGPVTVRRAGPQEEVT
jgi:hypothetical protein